MSPQSSFYERSFRLALDILRFYDVLRRSHALPLHIANQVTRAGTAIGANLQEAKSAYSRRDLAAKQAIALREARECLFWLRLIAAHQPRLEASVSPLAEECNQLIAMLTASVKTLRRTNLNV
jgi:four helix bundle protein